MTSDQRRKPNAADSLGRGPLHVLDASETRRLLPFEPLIDSLAHALQRRVYAPSRTSFDAPAGQWLVMPASDDDCAVCKMIRVSTNGDGPADISGVLLVLDHAGAPQVIADGAVVTARRTAATTAYITDLLALPEASVLALFGAGALAFPHVEAIDVVRPLSEIRVVARRSASSAELAATLRARGWNAWAATPSEAVTGADIITTLTTARVPVFADSDIAPGVHINAVGAHRADMREIPAPTFGRVRGVATDSPDTVLVEAGDVIHAREEGFLDHAPTFIDIRDRDGMAALRQQSTDVTLFKSVGHAISDLAAARLILRRLRAEVAGG